MRGVFLVLVLFNSGCVFAGIGAGIGAAVPEYAPASSADGSKGSKPAGLNPATENVAASMSDEALAELQQLATENARLRHHPESSGKRVGNYWAVGFGFGAVVDVLVVAAVGVALASSHPAGGTWGPSPGGW